MSAAFRQDELDQPGMEKVITHNINALVQRRHKEEQSMPQLDPLADAITCFTGSMRFVYL